MSNCVSLALANRSLCLGCLNQVEGALEDANAALNFGYPHVTKLLGRIGSLRERVKVDRGRGKALLATGYDTCLHFEDVSPQVNEYTQKQKVTSATRYAREEQRDLVDTGDFSLFCEDECGRGLKASVNLPGKKIILRETAYCSILDYDRFADFCYQCLVKLKSNHFYPCFTCTQVRFCSIDCANECTYHSHECHLIDLIKHNTNESNLAYRLSLRIILSEDPIDIMNALNQLKKQQQGQPSANVDQVQGTGLPSGYLGLLSLVDHQQNQYPLTKVTAFLTAFALNRRSNFNQLFKTYQLMHSLASLFLKHARQVKWNAMSISYRSLMPSDFKADVNILKEELIGVGIFHIQLLINHSCRPNIKTAKFNGRQVTLTTVESISRGQEILNSYGMFSKWQGFNYRQEYLRDNYSFICNCRSCVIHEEPLIRAYRCFSCNGPIIIEGLQDLSQGSKCSACQRTVTSTELTNLKKGHIAGNQTISAAVKFLSEYLNELDDTQHDDQREEDDNWCQVINKGDAKKILIIEQLLHTGHRKLTQVLYKDHRDCIMTLDTIVAFYIRIGDPSKLESALIYANQLLDYTKRVFDEDVHLFNTYLKVTQVYSFAFKHSRKSQDSCPPLTLVDARIGSQPLSHMNLGSHLIRLTSEAINLLHLITHADSDTFGYFVKHFNRCIR